MLAVVASVASLTKADNDGSQRTALDDYVFSEENLEQFSWFHASQYDFHATNPVTRVGYTAYMVNMTSGEWLTGEMLQ